MRSERSASDRQMTFGEHLAELRTRVIKSVAAILVGAVFGLIFNQWIRDVLISPYQHVVGEDVGLSFFAPTERFSVVMRIGLFGGVVLASPVVLYQLWRFVSPALTKRERRYVVPLSIVFTVLFLGGIALGYWTLPRGLEFLFEVGGGDDLEPIIQAEPYLTFVMRFLLAFGIAFEFPVFTFAAAAAGVVSSAQLRSGWRWAVVAIVVGGALITPSGDPLTLTLLSIPLYALYELTILAVKWVLRR